MRNVTRVQKYTNRYDKSGFVLDIQGNRYDKIPCVDETPRL